MNSNNLLNAGITVTVDNATYYKLIASCVVIIFAFFFISKLAK